MYHVVTGEYYWKLAADGPVSWYPKLISHRWHGLPGNIDAAFALPLGKIYFLKGDKTWVYKGSSLLPEYPRLISDVWKGIPKNVDAAMYCGKSTFFFFKGISFCYSFWAVTCSPLNCQHEIIVFVSIILGHTILILLLSTSMHYTACYTFQNHSFIEYACFEFKTTGKWLCCAKIPNFIK
jgi:hypothetical protein